MKLTKKVLSLLCIMTMLLSLLAGCGNTKKDESSVEMSSEAASAKSEEAKEELEYVELDWLSGIDSSRPDYQMVIDKLNEYLLEKINLKVNNIDYDITKRNTMLATGGNFIANIQNTSNVRAMAASGTFYPLNDLLDEYAPNTKALFAEDEWEAGSLDGEIFGIMSKKDNCYPIGILYNEDLAQELGLDIIKDFELTGWNWDAEQEKYWIDAKAKRDKLHPEWAEFPLLKNPGQPNVLGFQFENFFSSSIYAVCDIDYYDLFPQYDEETVFNFYDTDQYKDYCLMVQRLVAEGVYPYDYDNMNNIVANEPWGLATVAWGHAWLPDDYKQGESNWALRLNDVPAYTDTSAFFSTMNVISFGCKNPERAMMFLELINTDPYVSTLIRFGVEGVHWGKDEDGNMSLTAAPGYDPAVKSGYPQYWFGGHFGNIFSCNVPIEIAGPNNKSLRELEKINDSAIPAAHLGFVFDPTDVSAEVAACDNVVAEYTKILHRGLLSSEKEVLETIDAFRVKLKANGVDTIVKEVQEQINTFNAAQGK